MIVGAGQKIAAAGRAAGNFVVDAGRHAIRMGRQAAQSISRVATAVWKTTAEVGQQLTRRLRGQAPNPAAARIGELRGQVKALKDVGVGTKASRRAFFNGEQAAFARYDSALGEIDGWVQRSGDQVSSIIFSMKSRGPDGLLLPIKHAPVKGGTGMQLLSHHRSVSQRLGRAFGTQKVELGGTAVVNDDVMSFLQRLKFEERSVYSQFFEEVVPYYGRDFTVR